MGKLYNIITIDCPWTYRNFTKKVNGAAKSQYNCLSLDELKALPISQIAAENCALFMWITHPKMVEGHHVELLKAWEFKAISTAFTWVKTNKDGSPYTGIGFYTRGDSELCILGIKGKMPVKSHRVKQTIISPRTQHSAKPNEEFRKRIIELFGDYSNKIDIFSRPPVPQGWDAIGLEITGKQVTEDLQDIISGKFNSKPGIPITRLMAIQNANQILDDVR